MALPLTWHIAAIAGWVAQNVTTIFENIGVVQEGMRSIAVPRQMPDRPDAVALQVERGEVRFEDVRFGYGTARVCCMGSTSRSHPGERVGLVGPSGAGKSTLVNLLLRFYDLEDGRILIDGQDIALVTQESLRAQIAMVTQDTSLLHRSIRDNIRYGRLQASEWEIRRAAAQAHALEFVEGLEDWYGPARLRRACRRARRQALGRPAATHRAGPGDPQGCTDPGARRSDLGARFRGRGGDPGTARQADARVARSSPSRIGCRRSPASTVSLCSMGAASSRNGHPRRSCSAPAAPMRACGSANRAGFTTRRRTRSTRRRCQ